jgi:DNA segregation ATPase FtsK/SpoIIIE-like protein
MTTAQKIIATIGILIYSLFNFLIIGNYFFQQPPMQFQSFLAIWIVGTIVLLLITTPLYLIWGVHKHHRMEVQEDFDVNLNKAVELISKHDTVSAAFLQRKMAIGYAFACRIIDQLEKKGYVSEAVDGQQRKVYKKVSAPK